MEEIGCHFKLEKIIGNNYHNSNLMLSSGRNCLRFIIKEIKIWLSDLDGNIFILTACTTSKTDISKIEKLTNYNHLIYDLSLAKKFKLTSDNVRLTQTGIKYDFKFEDYHKT